MVRINTGKFKCRIGFSNLGGSITVCGNTEEHVVEAIEESFESLTSLDELEDLDHITLTKV